MAALELALVLLVVVLASVVLDQLIPHVSLPLIQISCGIAVAIFAQSQISITLNPDLFLVLFIAPLLFHEAREADKTSLWKNRRTMLSYAIGLVVAIVLAVGFAVNALIPSIPLAAAFALGAALGPTDPVAVASVSKNASISERQQTTLQGESLLNDASGIVSFQFAIAAVVTGAFSALEAIGAFLIEFFGALLVGIAFGFLLVKLAEKVRDLGLENTTFHVLLEVLTPFIAYLIGEAIGVSGVILVVACGITMSLAPTGIGPRASRMNIVSSSVWRVITFAFNGVVFVLLGTQLPHAFGDLWLDEGINSLSLLVYILVITAIMHGMRFIWTLASDAFDHRGAGEKPGLGQRMRSALVMTFAGSKGAITLAIMLSLPLYINHGATIDNFPQRDLLIFLASGVILVSLLLATFVVPLLAPRKVDPTESQVRDSEAAAEILRGVIEELTARVTDENRVALGPIILQYTERLERFKEKRDLEDESDEELRVKVLEWEQEYVLDLIENDEVPPVEGYQYVSRVARVEAMVKHGKNRRIAFTRWLRRQRTIVRKRWNKLLGRKQGEGPTTAGSIRRDIMARAAEYVVDRLAAEMPDSPVQSEKISQLIAEYQRTVILLRGPAPSITAITQNADTDLDATRLALRIELEKIQQAYDDGLISRAGARRMREAVYLMQLDLEDYL